MPSMSREKMMTKKSFFENWVTPNFSNAFPSPLSGNSFDMREMMDASRKSIQAFSEAQQVAAESMQAIIQRQTEIMSQLVQDQSTVARGILAEGTPEEKVARGAELIRETYEKAYGAAKEVSDIANKSTREACDIINERFSACLEEIQSSAEDAKEKKSKKADGKKAA